MTAPSLITEMNSHLSMTFGTKQGVRFVDELDQRRAGGPL